MIALLLVATLQAAAGGDPGAARLAEIRREFALRGKAASIAALERLAGDLPSSEAAGEARAWLGDLALQAGDLARARDEYERAERFGGATRRLALRGEGDVDLHLGRFVEAAAKYQAAAPGAPPVLAEELRQKHALAVTGRHRQLAAWLALALFALILGWLALRTRAALRSGATLRPPLEAIYALPVYALLILGCLGRDPKVLEALELGAAGSLVLIALSGLAARGTAKRWPQLVLVLAGNLALFYFALWRADLIDRLLMTLKMAAPG